MSRSWNSVRTAVILSDTAWLHERPRFGGAAGTLRRRLSPAGAADPAAVWQQLMAGESGAAVDAVIGSRWFRFGVLPWSLQSGRDADDRRAALALLDGAEALRGIVDVPAARVALAPARFGRDRFFAVCDPALATAFAAAPARAPRSWQPWALAAFAAVDATATPVLAVIEPGLATVLSSIDGWPEQVTMKRWPIGDTAALVTLLQTEQLRRNASLRVVVDAAPPAVRDALAASGFSAAPLLRDRCGLRGAGAAA